jgi:hypothetical protein
MSCWLYGFFGRRRDTSGPGERGFGFCGFLADHVSEMRFVAPQVPEAHSRSTGDKLSAAHLPVVISEIGGSGHKGRRPGAACLPSHGWTRSTRSGRSGPKVDLISSLLIILKGTAVWGVLARCGEPPLFTCFRKTSDAPGRRQLQPPWPSWWHP